MGSHWELPYDIQNIIQFTKEFGGCVHAEQAENSVGKSLLFCADLLHSGLMCSE